MTSPSACIRLSVLGAKGVGKTAIIVRYLTRRFIGEYHSQIDITYRHMISMSNRQTQIVIMDFSAKNDKDLVPDVESLISDCFLVVFSIDDRSSFLKAVNIVSMLRSLNACGATPITLLGNKKDLDHCRQVPTSELANMACLLSCQHAEVSVAESREDIVPIVFNLFKRASFPEQFNKQHLDNQKTKHPNFSSEPCLYQDSPTTSPNIRTKKDRSAEKTKDGLENESIGKLIDDRDNQYLKVSDSYLYSSKCEVCCLQHEKYPSLADLPPQLRSSFHSTKNSGRRKSNKNLPTRAYSFNLKDRRSQKTDSLPFPNKFATDFTYPYVSFLEERPPIRKREIKKDSSKFASLLSCSKGIDSDLPFKRSEPTSIASLLLRGRSFTNENLKSDSLKFASLKNNNNNSKSLSRARKTLPYRFLSPDSSSSKETSKLKKFSFDLPRPPSIRSLKLPPDLKNGTKPPPPENQNINHKRSFSTFDPLFIKKMGKASIEPSITGDAPKSSFFSQPDRRERKFGVFGIGALGSVFSKTSLPDLPKAASFYNKFGSIKNTIKKRSV